MKAISLLALFSPTILCEVFEVTGLLMVKSMHGLRLKQSMLNFRYLLKYQSSPKTRADTLLTLTFFFFC